MKTKLSILLMCAALLLSGCSFGTFSVDTLLTPPKLSQEQQEIHQCLIESVGNDITLKYPSSGDNRSAFVLSLDMQPMQVRIGDLIARSPDENKGKLKRKKKEKEPETKIAYVENENIYIEPISRSLMNDINMNS